MYEKEKPILSSSDKLIIKYKKKHFSFPKCLNIILFILFILSFLSLYSLSNIIESQKKEKTLCDNECKNKKFLLENLEEKIKIISNNISNYKKEIILVNDKYDNLTTQFLRKILEHKEKMKLLNYLTIEYSHLNTLAISAILLNKSQIEKIILYVKNNIYSSSDYHPIFKQIYKSSYDEKNGENFTKEIIGKSNVLILVKISEEIVFGGFFKKKISKNFTQDNSAFLFSLNHDEVYKIKEGKKPYWFYKEIFFCFGESDIFLYNNCFDNNSSAISNFPNSFGNSSCIIHRLTEGKKYFLVQDIEAYQLYNEN